MVPLAVPVVSRWSKLMLAEVLGNDVQTRNVFSAPGSQVLMIETNASTSLNELVASPLALCLPRAPVLTTADCHRCKRASQVGRTWSGRASSALGFRRAR
jgi:hypothetical protein